MNSNLSDFSSLAKCSNIISVSSCGNWFEVAPNKYVSPSMLESNCCSNKTSNSDTCAISAEARARYFESLSRTDLPALARNLPDDIDDELRQKLIESAWQVEYQIMMFSELKRLGMTGLATGDDFKDLAMVYDIVVNKLNGSHDNSDGLEHDIKLINSAFFAVTDSIYRRNAEQHFWEIARNLPDLPLHTEFDPRYNGRAATLFNQVTTDAKGQADLFVKTFLEYYEKEGMGAFDIAMALLKDSYKTVYSKTLLPRVFNFNVNEIQIREFDNVRYIGDILPNRVNGLY